MKEGILESGEDYLETILVLHNRNGEVRSIDIAAELDYSKPSVSVAMKNLRERECITVDKNGFITLTEKGREIAERVYERHVLFTNWLTSMGVPEDIAAEDACRIEHCLSTESFEAIKKHVQQYNK
ncbi:MAG: metal-dependent transcriptional regulator [Ruminococcaceae bacterium]|nr:metal-dependent transcriptional regulator [Oscillospiraceae bacterium]